MGQNKAHAHTEGCQRVFLKLVDSSGTPSIANVYPSHAAGDVSVVDTATGRATITIKNFKGPVGEAFVFSSVRTTSLMVGIVSQSYSGDDFTFEVSVENDASTLTDATVGLMAVAY